MNKNVGVLVGRFQTPYLHLGYMHLIGEIRSRHNNVLILVAVNGGWTSKRNPLDFETRKKMILDSYPNAIIVPIKDHPSDHAWSENLDALVRKSFPEHAPTLYASRDAFFPHYHGLIETVLLPEVPQVSATTLREEACREPLGSDNFRRGVIYASTKQNYPTSFQAVDIIIRHSTEAKVLVGRKKGEDGWRFPGGFVSPEDPSLEFAAAREGKEECGDIEIVGVHYIGSHRCDDYRYRDSEHRLMTAVFTGTYIFGHIEARDDLDEVRWQEIEGLEECLIESHKPLAKIYLENPNK
jgi:bifunctional NMN adenylyltransferase/nudix hydrolase